MKKRGMALALAFAIGATSFQGCIGNFVLTKKILNWNQRVSSNKWINEIIFVVMVIIPVYGACVLVDGIVLNSVEFWTGSNPLAMKPGEVETKYVTEGEKTYKIEVSRNRYHFEQVTGPNMGEEMDLVYNPETQTWLLGNGREIKKAVQIIDGNQIKIFKKDGESFVMSRDLSPENIDAILNANM